MPSSFCPSREIPEYCMKCRYHQPKRKSLSHRCNICKDSTLNAKIHLHTYKLVPLYFEEKPKKNIGLGQMYFRF